MSPESSIADSLYNNLDFSSINADSSIMSNNYSVNKIFSNFSQVIATLNKLGATTKIINQPENEPTNITIMSNRTVKDFIDIASIKFGYKWILTNNTVIFTPANPQSKVHKPLSVTSCNPTNPLTQTAVSSPYYATPMVPLWVISTEDKTLRNALTKWCKQSGWQLVWNAKANYPIDSTWRVEGGFESAVNQVLKATQYAEVPLIATMYDSNHVLEIRSQEVSR